MGPSVPPAPTAGPAGGPKRTAHGWARTAPKMSRLHPTGFHRYILGASGAGGKNSGHAGVGFVQAFPGWIWDEVEVRKYGVRGRKAGHQIQAEMSLYLVR